MQAAHHLTPGRAFAVGLISPPNACCWLKALSDAALQLGIRDNRRMGQPVTGGNNATHGKLMAVGQGIVIFGPFAIRREPS